jgi:hypothetical protein
MHSQIIHLELRTENRLNFPGLMRIARCKQELDHGLIEI